MSSRQARCLYVFLELNLCLDVLSGSVGSTDRLFVLLVSVFTKICMQTLRGSITYRVENFWTSTQCHHLPAACLQRGMTSLIWVFGLTFSVVSMDSRLVDCPGDSRTHFSSFVSGNLDSLSHKIQAWGQVSYELHVTSLSNFYFWLFQVYIYRGWFL